MAARYGLTIRVNAPGTFPVPNEAARVLLFNLVRELLFNVVKHAEVSEATVTLAEDAEQLTLIVSDLGKGFDLAALEQTATGLGLLGVRKRLELFDGCLKLVSAPGEGTYVTIRLPTKLFTLT
jgi:signal transduction histidine kinase